MDPAACWPSTTDRKPVLPLPPSDRANQAVEEDEDEWEYEYSATETETYYVTLDLSIADFLGRTDTSDLHMNGRGGYRTWFNPLFADPEAVQKDKAAMFRDAADDKGEFAAREDIARASRDDDSVGGIKSQQPARAVTVEKAERLQVLGLHSDNPIISYRSKLFSGTWAQNIGTELLFAARDPAKPPVPALRELPDNVDLLAASSVRLSCTEIKIERTDAARGPSPDPEERYKQLGGICIPVLGDLSGRRRPQARFLEDLIALKRRRGDQDIPTVGALEAPYVSDCDDDTRDFVLSRKRKRERDQRRRHRHRASKMRKTATRISYHHMSGQPMRANVSGSRLSQNQECGTGFIRPRTDV